ncbi:MAG: 4-alpha-glucanotransferase [Alphaproteobacteria bacterium]|nr:4-alpha-glucanotransferase [Alphaproteobacteria bacterium]
MSDAALTERARKAGLAPEWIDASGRAQTVAPDTLRSVLDALGGYELADAQICGEERCFSIEEAAPGRRVAGIAVQLYGLRGSDGFGDLGALARLAREAGALGIDAIAVSPIHAPFLAAPDDISPYAPSSRLFLNPLYAAENLPDDGRDGLIDWPRAARDKIARLRERLTGAPIPCTDARLRDHARFETLDAHFRARGLYRWQDWPVAYRDPRGAEVDAFAREHAAEIDFHIALQKLTEESLAEAQAEARDAGMAIGPIADVAVGMSPHGSHAWSAPNEVLRGVTIGAPPDIFNPSGQNWGLTALSPGAGPAAFADTWSASMRHAGGVRIDHAMGLCRLWVIPEGGDPKDGVYLRYPMRMLLGTLAQVSRHHRAVVIGEDLGTVPDGFREAMRGAGILGMEVLWFQRDDRRFLAPERWSRQAAALTTTHDLPTVAGWWRGQDIDWLERLGRKSEHGDVAAERWARHEDRAHLWSAIGRGLEPSPEEPERVVQSALEFVGRTPCEIAIVPLEDVLGLAEQPNIPGTIDEHPNWRRRLPVGRSLSDAQSRASLEALVGTRR